MIASLSGKVIALDSSSAIIDVSGVGYQVALSSRTSSTLSIGSQTNILTTLIVREDAFSLFGFMTGEEQRIFDLLRSVTGVGPKSAIAILSTMNPDEIAHAVSIENDSAFRQVSGVGPKTAKLIILTLTGKLKLGSAQVLNELHPNVSEVLSALIGLGWNERIAIDAVQQVQRSLGIEAPTNSLLKSALSFLGSAKSVGATDE